ncbi:MAG: YraN family protein [Salinivirgaceae bacterium]|jgi:putative endonuclease|nr:YraN family protein [Bacteroidales bacterium]
MAEHNDLGKYGEELALKYLRNAGFQIRCTNWRFRKYEVDIIAVKDNTLVFVEVKTRTPSPISTPEDSMTRAKQKQLINAADTYIKANDIEMESRIDLISIYVKGNKHWIKHYENAVTPQW